MNLAKGLSVLFIFSKNQLLVLFIFTIVSFYFCFRYFCSDLYDLFPSTNFGIFLVLLFPVVSGMKLVSLFNVFPCFLGWDCIAINFLRRPAFAASHRF